MDKNSYGHLILGLRLHLKIAAEGNKEVNNTTVYVCVRVATSCQCRFYDLCHVERLCNTDPLSRPLTSLLHPFPYSCSYPGARVTQTTLGSLPTFDCRYEKLLTFKLRFNNGEH